MWNEKTLWKLRKGIILCSLYYADYKNNFGVDIHACCDFFDSYCEYLGELMQEEAGDNYDFFALLPKYDNSGNLYNWYGCYEDESLPVVAEVEYSAA